MSGTAPNFADWRLFASLEVWQIASIANYIDPRALGDVVVNDDGDPIDLSIEIDALISALHAGELVAVPASATACSPHTRVAMESLILWLAAHGYEEVAENLRAPDQQVKRRDLVAELQSRWPAIENDLKAASANGLDQARGDGQGWWYRGRATRWAKAHGRWVEGARRPTSTWPPA